VPKSVFKTFAPYSEDAKGEIKPTPLDPVRKIGTGPTGVHYVKLLRQQGAMCRYGIKRDHIIESDLCDEGRALVAVTRQVDDVIEDSITPKYAVSRTVVWTGTKEAFAYYFSEGHRLTQ
jgi:hypothetical protein